MENECVFTPELWREGWVSRIHGIYAPKKDNDRTKAEIDTLSHIFAIRIGITS